MAKMKRAEGGRTRDDGWDAREGTDAMDDAPSDVYAGKDSGVASEAKGDMVKRKTGGKVEKKQGFKDRLDETKAKKKRDEMKAGHKVNEMLDKTRADRRATHAKDERVERKTGGRVETVSGHGSKPRLDRAARKRGGGIGSDSSPLTSAARITDRRDGGGEDRLTGGN